MSQIHLRPYMAMEMAENESINHKYCSRINSWANELHGLTQMFMARTWKERGFWLFVIIICLFGASFNTIDVMNEYLEKQTSTLYIIRQESKLLLPSLTICPKDADAFDGYKVIKEIQQTVPDVDEDTAFAVIEFMVAGYGFGNMEQKVTSWTSSEIHNLSSIFDQWRGNRSLVEIFIKIFETDGYKCQDIMESCILESQKVPCCDLMESVYVLIRGRCFRLKPLNQTTTISPALTIAIRSIPSYFSNQGGWQALLVSYVSDYTPYVPIYPRYYINEDEWTTMIFHSRKIEMLPNSKHCIADDGFESRGACFIKQWLRNIIIKPYNCTLAYLQSFAQNLSVCHPKVVVQNYFQAMSSKISNFRCLPECNRKDLIIQKYSSPIIHASDRNNTKYLIEMSHLELQYELYKEVTQTTIPGFISQIGGQFGLFLGVSFITVLKIIVEATKLTYQAWHTVSRLHMISIKIIFREAYQKPKKSQRILLITTGVLEQTKLLALKLTIPLLRLIPSLQQINSSCERYTKNAS
ncbi:unnamed protein product [Thelazia callipaeda]|uniref:Acid-sensing ion channel 5 n=1 Tax=Thelazia callipaeda TaxID=103827 RepID=A0A0N5CPV8_THECL|nr:unnamed protein product [Thelazia callipaeda]